MKLTIALLAGLVLGSSVPEAREGQDPIPSLKHLISAKNEESKANLAEDAGLGRLIDRIGSAFERGDADALEACLVPRKVYLSLRAPGDEAGYYGKSQVRFMFQKLFRERKTDSFLYDSGEIEIASSGTAYFRAEWSFTAVDENEVKTEELRFKLDKTKNDWSVSEIRTLYR